MKKYIPIFLTMLFASINLLAQTLTINNCHRMAIDNYPLTKRYNLIAQTEKYSLENASKSYLPQISLNGQASYQSTVTELPIDFSGMNLPIDVPTMNKDQYKATVDVSQIIWDGGSTNSQKNIIRANRKVEQQQVEVSLYAIKEKINQLYFSVLSIDEQLKILDLNEADILANKEIVQTMLKNGVAIQADLDMMEIEMLNINQKRIEQMSMRQSYLKVLGLFINQSLNDETKLEIPIDENIILTERRRPELTLYDSQISLLHKQKSLISAKNRPQFGLFAQGGYGRPGLNMLENKFNLFAIGGIKLSWNFGNLYTKKNENRLISIQTDDVEVQRETFQFNTNLELTQELAEIQKVKKLLQTDDEIVQLRHKVKLSGESRYKNGTYQINELLRDINAESRARQTKAMRKIHYLLSIYNYKHIQGN